MLLSLSHQENRFCFASPGCLMKWFWFWWRWRHKGSPQKDSWALIRVLWRSSQPWLPTKAWNTRCAYIISLLLSPCSAKPSELRMFHGFMDWISAVPVQPNEILQFRADFPAFRSSWLNSKHLQESWAILDFLLEISLSSSGCPGGSFLPVPSLLVF